MKWNVIVVTLKVLVILLCDIAITSISIYTRARIRRGFAYVSGKSIKCWKSTIKINLNIAAWESLPLFVWRSAAAGERGI